MNSQIRPIVMFTEGSYYPDALTSVFPRLGPAAEVRSTEATTPEELINELSLADVVVTRRVWFPAELFHGLPRLRGLVKWGSGVEKIDVAAATAAGVIVANAPGNSFAVAEAAMLLISALAKNLMAMNRAAKEEIAPAFDVRGHELYQKTLGIAGFGRVGRHLARIGRGFNMSVLAYDPYAQPDRFAKAGARQVDLPMLLRESDYVSINCTLTPETHHLIGEEELALMKPTAYLVNTARGPIVDEPALYRALVEGRIAGAGLDVFEDEPLKATNPLLALPNVVATPHALSRSWESAARTACMIQDAVLAILDRRLPETILNPDVKSKGAVQ